MQRMPHWHARNRRLWFTNKSCTAVTDGGAPYAGAGMPHGTEPRNIYFKCHTGVPLNKHTRCVKG